MSSRLGLATRSRVVVCDLGAISNVSEEERLRLASVEIEQKSRNRKAEPLSTGNGSIPVSGSRESARDDDLATYGDVL